MLLLRINHRFIILLALCISFTLTSCGKSSEDATEKVKPVIILNDANIKQFTQTLAKDYITTQKSLLDAFYSHQKSGNAYGFTQYRNSTWTPTFIEKKDYYQTVLNKNRDYITKKSIKPLFLRFENLIYVGVNLKIGLLDENQDLIKETLTEAAEDKKIVSTLTKQILQAQ